MTAKDFLHLSFRCGMHRNYTSVLVTNRTYRLLRNLKSMSMMKYVVLSTCRLNQSYHYYYIDLWHDMTHKIPEIISKPSTSSTRPKSKALKLSLESTDLSEAANRIVTCTLHLVTLLTATDARSRRRKKSILKDMHVLTSSASTSTTRKVITLFIIAQLPTSQP